MKDIYTLLEKLYAHKEYAVSRRFLPVVVVSVFAIVATVIGLGDIAPNPVFKIVALSIILALVGVLWVNATLLLPHERRWLKHAKKMVEDCDYKEAERTLSSPPRLIGFTASIKRLESLANLKMESGDLVAAYACLLDAEQRILLPDERFSLQQVRATLMFKAGNYAAFEKVLGELSSEIPKSGLLRFRNALLNSHLHELKGQFSDAKALLEVASEIAPEPKLVAVALNNLARLEDMQGNDTNAQSYYERAWKVLRANPMPRLYPVIGHNLLIKYGRNGAVDKALNLMSEYRAMVSPTNLQQHLQFLNDQVHLARQLGNRVMLLENYEYIERVLMLKIDKCERLALNVSELRMRFSDGLPVADQLADSVALLDENRNLTVENRIHVLREFLGVLKQCNAIVDGRDFTDLQRRVIAELLAMEVEIDTHLRDTPPVLPSIRDVWYGHKLEIGKIRMGLSAPRFSRSDFDKMFNLLHQRQQVWADKGNPEGELDALIGICDEFATYAEPLGPQFASDYGTMAKQSLNNAAEVLAIHWPHPSVQRHALGVAYFYWQLANDEEGAELWLLHFEKLGLNPAHYAPWFRKWHTDVQGWLISLKQNLSTKTNLM